jgi:2-dehydrotetronate isomerase
LALIAANLGFLWKELPFLERIERAAKAGFTALEFHDQAQFEDPADLQTALAKACLPVLSMNTLMDDTFGIAAMPGREADARQAIQDSARIAKLINAKAIHVTAGKADGDEAREAYVSALIEAVSAFDGTILIEPISRSAVPGYFLYSLHQARDIADTVNHPRVKMMFDLYHVRALGYHVLEVAQEFLPFIGHIQISNWPDRDEPVLASSFIGMMRALGYDGDFGAEYKPKSDVEDGLDWLPSALAAAG